jgi:hypothetical protein
MLPLILISILAISVILCLVLLIRMILGDSRSRDQMTMTRSDSLTTSIVQFQQSQTRQIGELLDRHSKDLRQVLNAQSDYISRFLNGPTIQPTTDQGEVIEGPNLDLADPANWPEADQIRFLPRQIQDEIYREQEEQTEVDRLSRPSHNIRTDPRIPLIVPGRSSQEQPKPEGNGSWTMYDGPEV